MRMLSFEVSELILIFGIQTPTSGAKCLFHCNEESASNPNRSSQRLNSIRDVSAVKRSGDELKDCGLKEAHPFDERATAATVLPA